jgi:hypothetical protein
MTGVTYVLLFLPVAGCTYWSTKVLWPQEQINMTLSGENTLVLPGSNASLTDPVRGHGS